jgi:hypothetical protein
MRKVVGFSSFGISVKVARLPENILSVSVSVSVSQRVGQSYLASKLFLILA